MSEETKEQTQEVVEDKKEEQSSDDLIVKGQYDQSLYVADRKAKIDLIVYDINKSGEDKQIFSFLIQKPEGEKISLLLNKEDIANISTLLDNSRYIFSK